MANGWSVIHGLIVVILLGVASYFFAPKGENQTIWRFGFLLTLASTYMMWALTLLAQLHPLVQPLRSDLRPETESKAFGVL
ncbi:hypothetical protein BJ508DRAFT_413306 [Ascobolus immersus RN42]|uniref:V-type proton ATPase subunit E n=1 Tax=Ascobolus immersus RN42 TaxID=1160509 RepID=A0A3N4IHK7_ASCIM|nr:hypothetical protein BJ508DRAFT_413306 [Ascobolus immersus RN42]